MTLHMQCFVLLLTASSAAYTHGSVHAMRMPAISPLPPHGHAPLQLHAPLHLTFLYPSHSHPHSQLLAPGLSSLSPDEARVRAVAEIVSALIAGVRQGADVDLNALKSQVRPGGGDWGCGIGGWRLHYRCFDAKH